MTQQGAAFDLAVVSEAGADQQVACGLAERILLDEVDWLDPSVLPETIQWRGLDATTRFLSWSQIRNAVKRSGLRRHGGFGGVSGALDERSAREALLLLKDLEPPPRAVILVRDTDGDEKRVESLERARREKTSLKVVLATPHTKMECWVLAGFDPQDKKEEGALKDVRSELGFDPRLKAEELTAGGKKGKRNAKIVLDRLVPGGIEHLEREDAPRARSCWQETGLDVLRERGEKSLLASFLAEVSEHVVSLMNSKRP